MDLQSQTDSPLVGDNLLKGRSKLQSLEAVRALAAVMVVLYHSQIISGKFSGFGAFQGLMSSGKRGVDLFFVLSGFVIYYVHARDFGRRDQIAHYCYNRASRIFPILWIVTVLLIPLFILDLSNSGETSAFRPWNMIASFLLLPQVTPPFVSVSWTLKYELFFYAIFAISIINIRVGMIVFVMWQVATFIMVFTGIDFLPFYANYYLRPVSLEFGIGVASAMLVIHSQACHWSWPPSFPIIGLVLGAAIFLTAGYYDPVGISGDTTRCLVFGLSSGLIITSLVMLELSDRFEVSRPWGALGAASYAIYLVHYSVIRAEIYVLTKIGFSPKSNPQVLGLALAAIVAGYMFYLAVDRPIQRLLRSNRRRVLA